MDDTCDVVVVGGGLIGLATAFMLAERSPDLTITVLEAESGVARHQSGRNSGVLHSGVYYEPGTLKAALCVDGARRMVAFCVENGIAMERTGKVIVATAESELDALRSLQERGRGNGLKDLELVDERGLREFEPNASGMMALVVPQAGIVDFAGVAEKLAEILRSRGHHVRTGFQVASIGATSSDFNVTSRNGDRLSARHLANCAGLQSDRVATMAGVEPPIRILPFRGEYYVLAPERAHLVRNLVYPVPDPRFPFLGVHFTRRIDNTVEVGPNAVLALGRHHYRGEGGANLRDAAEMVRSRELWTLARRYWRTGSQEAVRSRSRRLYASSARRLIPEVKAADLRRGGSGIRAQAVARDGTLVDDFVIEATDRAVHVLNAPSPAATACLAIGERIADRILRTLI